MDCAGSTFLEHAVYNHGQKVMAKRQKTALTLTPQAM